MRKQAKSVFYISLIIMHAFSTNIATANTVASKHETADLAALSHFKNSQPAQKSEGIKAVNTLGTLPLAGELNHIDNMQFRVREIQLLPNAKIAVHTHKHRPGVAYIISGEVVEYRSDEAQPIVRKAGQVLFEKHDLTHWWHNQSDELVKALVVDIVPVQK